MSTDPSLADLLSCPATQQPLRAVDEARLDELNEAIGAGQLQNDAGDAIDQPLDGALIRHDDAVAYPIRGGVPNLTVSDRIRLDQPDDEHP